MGRVRDRRGGARERRAALLPRLEARGRGSGHRDRDADARARRRGREPAGGLLMSARTRARRALLALIAAGTLGGCGFDPQFPEGTISCRTEKDCPPAHVCAQSLCYSRTAALAAGGAGAGPAGATGTGGLAGAGGTATDPDAGTPPIEGGAPDAGPSDVATQDGPAADGACTDACSLGAHRCGTTGLQTCVKVGACTAYSVDVACGGRQTCQAAGGDSKCGCPTRPAGCEGGAGAVCTAGKLRTCAADADGCIFEQSLDVCTTGKPCAGAFPTAACTCPAPPALCGGKSGTVCEATLSVATCGPNADGCLDLTKHTTCAAAKPCSGNAPSATCSCTSAPPECAGQAGFFCRADGQRSTCDLDASGCLAITTSAPCAAGLTCQGASPAAKCACPAPPTECAAGIGTACRGTTTVVTCARDANGCLVSTGTTSCPAGKPCAGTLPSATCTCPAPPTICQAGTGTLCDTGKVDTCSQDGNGCIVLASSVACPTGKPCAGSFPGAACTCPEPPPGCGSGAAGSSCSATSVVTCTVDGNGCFQAATSSCPTGKPCGGGFPAATCTCPAAPAGCGSGVGAACSGNSVVTCSKDANLCFQAATGGCGTGNYCVGAFPSAACVTPQALGDSVYLTGASSKTAGFLSGQSISVTATSTLRSFGLITRQAGTNVSFGLYTDVGGKPATLVASAQYGALVVVGRAEFPAVAAAGGSLTLLAGTYWIMVMYDNTTSIAAAPAGGSTTNRNVLAAGWGDLPPSLPAASVTSQSGVIATNYYALVTTP